LWAHLGLLALEIERPLFLYSGSFEYGLQPMPIPSQ
jgi:hypothetical protein